MTLRDDLISSTFSNPAMSLNNAAMSSSMKKLKSRCVDNVMSKSAQGSCPSVNSVMSNSLPSYDLHRLFKGPEILQVIEVLQYKIGANSIKITSKAA